MLNINPKQRPNILDILNKQFVKQHVINYMGEVFGNNELDEDEMNLESIRDQAYKLNIVSNVKDYVINKYKDHNKLSILII